jgi:hypothetical protein
MVSDMIGQTLWQRVESTTSGSVLRVVFTRDLAIEGGTIGTLVP